MGSIIAIILTPISQSLSFYLSEFLARPALSIEYVEQISFVPRARVDGGALQSVVASHGFEKYVQEHQGTQGIFIGVGEEMSTDQIETLLRALNALAAEQSKGLAKIDAATTLISSASDP